MNYSSKELRRMFLEYFAERGHEVVASSPLVPANDPTLLFTNAGMVQFKDAFLGREKRAVSRAATAQRCVRAGGKHNDLENVGYTARHHTFFEMLGNFSFGDYFKREAIGFAWAFVTEVLKLPPQRLWCTVYKDDDEAAAIWLDEIGIDPARFSRLGEEDNFWAMGDTGPCGPCTEIFYDHGADLPGVPPGAGDTADRYVEIWNLVFMQYDRDQAGNLAPLPRPSVDTGMGLERLAAVMQGVHSNYDIDLFVNLIRDAAKATGTADLTHVSLRVIADHIRACSFLIADGVLPGNEGRGYVLRRIIRRAVRHGYQLGVQQPFFHTLVAGLEQEMGEAYPLLTERRAHVERVLHQEELRFAETLAQGMRLLEEAIAGLEPGGVIAGETVFRLYDTYGFPEDLTADIARERGFVIDSAGFEQAMQAQRERARRASRFSADSHGVPTVDAVTDFVGYEQAAGDAEVVALYRGEQAVDALERDESGIVVLDNTPFYAESGGQVGDTGQLLADGTEFVVSDTRKFGAAHGHVGSVRQGRIAVGDRLQARIDEQRRAAIVLNHSATHLLHAALRAVLGEHVQQKGSLVAPDRLRFDFSHYEPVSAEELARIEDMVNEQVRANSAGEISELPYQEAVAAGAIAFFGDKYGDRVRVLRLGDGFSVELCGGTHVRRTGDIGLFKIIAESGIAAGVRRIEAVTGRGALDYVNSAEAVIRDVAGMVRAGRDDVTDKVGQLVERNRQLERELDKLRQKLASGGGRDLIEDAREVAGIRVLASRLDGADSKALREAADRLKDKLGKGVVVLGAVDGDKVRLVAGVTANLTDSIRAGDIIAPVAEHVGGRGGGRADFAQAGGNRPDLLDEALSRVAAAVAEKLQTA